MKKYLEFIKEGLIMLIIGMFFCIVLIISSCAVGKYIIIPMVKFMDKS